MALSPEEAAAALTAAAHDDHQLYVLPSPGSDSARSDLLVKPLTDRRVDAIPGSLLVGTDIGCQQGGHVSSAPNIDNAGLSGTHSST